MVCRIFIENPPPFKQAPRGEGGALVDVEIFEGVATARLYLAAGLSLAGLHHSDLDRYEARRIRGEGLPDRHDSLDYVRTIVDHLGGFGGIFVPHRVTVYQPPKDHEAGFRRLAQFGVRNVVLVGRPYSVPPPGVAYRSSVEETLAYLTNHASDLGLNLGVIGIHTRAGEVERIVGKFAAAGGRLRVMGQFLDEVKSLTLFIDQLTRAFEQRRLDLGAVEWNVGLAMFFLKNRAFYAKLLRRAELACEGRFVGLNSIEERITTSIDMDVEFAQQAREHGLRRGLDIGFSIQPLIERGPTGAIHPAVYGAIELARRLQHVLA